MFTPSREYHDKRQRQIAAVRDQERRERERLTEQFDRRKASLARVGGVAGRNGVWQYFSNRPGARPVIVHVFPDEREGVVGWGSVCSCQAMAQCWHQPAAVERELEFLQQLKDRQGWGHEAIDTPLRPVYPHAVGGQVEDLGGGCYRVESDTTPGVSYSVQIVEGVGVCDCPSDAAECKHVARVKELER